MRTGEVAMVEVRPHPLGFAVYYAGTILFIGAKAAAIDVAKRFAQRQGVEVARA